MGWLVAAGADVSRLSPNNCEERTQGRGGRLLRPSLFPLWPGAGPSERNIMHPFESETNHTDVGAAVEFDSRFFWVSEDKGPKAASGAPDQCALPVPDADSVPDRTVKLWTPHDRVPVPNGTGTGQRDSVKLREIRKIGKNSA